MCEDRPLVASIVETVDADVDNVRFVEREILAEVVDDDMRSIGVVAREGDVQVIVVVENPYFGFFP